MATAEQATAMDALYGAIMALCEEARGMAV